LLGFHPTWINWIGQCITTSSFSILLDGSPYGNFKPSRGIRQRDPLSHFLFILGKIILSRLILRDKALGSLQGINVAPLSPPISHLLFADDVMIFARAKVQDANAIFNCLSTYSKWSGQCINLSKSAVFFNKNCSVNAISEVNGILNLPLIPIMAKYLGIPLFFSHNKRDAFMDIKEDMLRDYWLESQAFISSCSYYLVKICG
jgi:hypothetical protein